MDLGNTDGGKTGLSTETYMQKYKAWSDMNSQRLWITHRAYTCSSQTEAPAQRRKCGIKFYP